MNLAIQESWAKWFLKPAGVLLLLTGSAKLMSGFGQSPILKMQDPLFGLTFEVLLPATGAAEVVIGTACFASCLAPRFKAALLAWMATNFLVYRIGLWFVGWHHPCHCMGNLAGALHLSDERADLIMKGMLAFLLAGSYLLLLRQWQAGHVGEGRLCAPEMHVTQGQLTTRDDRQ